MPLINCPDCKKKISARASTCPGCGAPIMKAKETVDTGVQQLATIQDTGKRPKLHTLGPLIMLIVGVLWIIAAAKPTLDDVEISGWLITIGFTWYAATKIRVTPQMGAGHIHRLRQ